MLPGIRNQPRQRVDCWSLSESYRGFQGMFHRESSYNSQAVHLPSSKPLSVQFRRQWCAPPDMTQSFNVEVSGFAYIVDVAVEGQSFIQPYLPLRKTSLATSRSFSSTASGIWNNLPVHVSSASTVFRRNLKHHLFLHANPGFTTTTIKVGISYSIMLST